MAWPWALGRAVAFFAGLILFQGPAIHGSCNERHDEDDEDDEDEDEDAEDDDDDVELSSVSRRLRLERRLRHVREQLLYGDTDPGPGPRVVGRSMHSRASRMPRSAHR